MVNFETLGAIKSINPPVVVHFRTCYLYANQHLLAHFPFHSLDKMAGHPRPGANRAVGADDFLFSGCPYLSG